MDGVTLTTDGTLIHGLKTVQNDPLIFLGHQVDLEDGYTLRSFFRMFEKYPVLTGLSAFLPTFLEQYRDASPKGSVLNGPEHLELGKTVELVGFPGEPRLEIYTSFYGVQSGEQVKIEASRLENLLDIPVKLGRLKHILLGDKMDIFEFDTFFSLFEFIGGITWQLSFHGAPILCDIRR